MTEGRGVQLTVVEARAILIADEALCASYEARLASGSTFGIEERESWKRLVESAEKRVDEYAGARILVSRANAELAAVRDACEGLSVPQEDP